MAARLKLPATDYKYRRESGNSWSLIAPRAVRRLSRDLKKVYGLLEASDRPRVLESERLLRDILHELPAHLEALLLMCLVHRARGNDLEAYLFAKEAVAIGWSAMPGNFEIGRDLLPWDGGCNRDFLRAQLCYGCILAQLDYFLDAYESFIDLLQLCPSDEGGARYHAIEVALSANKPRLALKAIESGSDDSAGMRYNQALAWLSIGRVVKARELLETAVRSHPAIARALLSPSLASAPQSRPDAWPLPPGGDPQNYVARFGEFWQTTKGARVLLAATLEGLPRSAPQAVLESFVKH